MAKIVYFSQTGQTRKYVEKVQDYEKVEITPEYFSIEMDEPFILVVPSYETHVFPIVIDTVACFLETAQNRVYCKGIFGGGNRNFAQLFCVTARTLSIDYQIPVIHEFEFQGSILDVEKLEEVLDKIDKKAIY